MTIIAEDRLYSEEHEWVKMHNDEALIGISDHAQCSLGDVVYVELPECGTEIVQGKPIGVVESVKAVSDIFAPLSGTIIAVNNQVIEQPERINQDPYGEGWLLKIKIADGQPMKPLLNNLDYQKLLSAEAK